MVNKEATTGLDYLDNLLGGLRIGDNLVWETEAGTYIDVFVEKFMHGSLVKSQKVVYVSFNKSPLTMCKKLLELPNHKNLILLDCFTAGKGNNDYTFTRFYELRAHPFKNNVVRLEEPRDIAQFKQTLNRIEEKEGQSTRYVFDSLTGMQDLWGDEAQTYKFFTYSCPRLYDLQTVAYWILEKEAHSAAFRANLKHVTQIALDLSCVDHQLVLRVSKAEGRFSLDLFKPQKFEIWDNEIIFQAAREREILDLGAKLKALRRERGLSQKELAKRAGLTASFISQLEQNFISPSIHSLIRLSNELKVEPTYFLTSQISGIYDRIVLRKNQRKNLVTSGLKSDKVRCQRLTSSVINRRMEALLVTIDAHTGAPGHLFEHKGDEFILILKGEIELEIQNKRYVLREGDTIYLESAMPSSWRNRGDLSVQALWVLSPPRT